MLGGLSFFCAAFTIVVVLTEAQETTTENTTNEDEFSKIFQYVQNNKTSEILNNNNNNNNNNSSTVKANQTSDLVKTQSSQTQQIERTLEPFLVSTSNKSVTKLEKVNKLSDFKPSPQLETIYEYNKFPVVPAFPEAKQFSGYNTGEFPIRASIPWVDKYSPTTEQPWFSRIKFPSPSVSPQTVKEYHPYPFINDHTTKENKPSVGFVHKNKASTGSIFGPSSKPTGLDKSSHNKFGGGGYGSIVNKGPQLSSSGWDKPIMHKTHYDYNVYDSKPHSNGFEVGEKGHYGSSISQNHSPQHSTDLGLPWKKIIKFLTAFIPIGLLISALTPTVITVSAMNNTQTRFRAEDSNQEEAAKRLLASLNYFNRLNGEGCEERILCELLLSASNSENAEHHVQNFLNNFGEQEKNVTEKIKQMKRIYEAVKKQNCDPIVCKNIMEKT